MKADKKHTLSIGELAKRSEVAVSTLHFYEQKGLITSHRNGANHRIYPRYMLRRVALIKAAQTLGVSLGDIKERFKKLPLDSAPTEQDWLALSSEWQAMLTSRIKALTVMQNALTQCIDCGCLSTRHCPIRNPEAR